MEDVQAARGDSRERLRGGFASMRAHLMDGPFICGDAPAYCDFIVFGSLRWAELCSDYPLFDPDDSIAAWYGRVKDAMDVT